MGEKWTDERLDDLQGEMNRRFNQVDKRFDKLEGEMNRRFEAVDRRFDEASADVNRRFGEVGKRFDAVDKRFDKVDSGLARINDRMDSLVRTIVLIHGGFAATLLGVLVAAILGVGQL